jgi:hypothetical protein
MEQLVLHKFLLEQQQPPGQHTLTSWELGIFAEAFGPLLFHARFMHPLKRALVERFQDSHPAFAAKLDQMSHQEFELLCEQVQARTRRGA